MKQCSKCKESKAISEFTKNKTKIDGLNHNCRECQRTYNREHYKQNKKYYISKAQKSDKKQRELLEKQINQIKSKPCTDCKNSFPPEAMDFDHVRGKKLFEIAQKMRVWDLNKILKEIDKCELVCSNCHRIRTKKRLGGILDVHLPTKQE